MQYKKFDLWTTGVHVIDNLLDDQCLYEQLKSEALIGTTIEGQDHFSMSEAQSGLFEIVSAMVTNYCVENNIDFDNLELNDIQKGCLYRYDSSMVGNHLYEPHHDIAERGYITAIYYIDSDYKEDRWVGGELAIYKQLTFADYPDNCINILPKQNRLIIFPGYCIHRVKPYFGDKPRTSMVFGWAVKDGKLTEPMVI